jgi:hypothetical protein
VIAASDNIEIQVLFFMILLSLIIAAPPWFDSSKQYGSGNIVIFKLTDLQYDADSVENST